MLACTEAAAAQDASKPTSRTIVGEILSIDIPKRNVVVAQAMKAHGRAGAAERETVTIHVPFSTPVARGKRAASLTDLKPRDHAVVRYQVTPQGARALSLQVADLATPTPLAASGS